MHFKPTDPTLAVQVDEECRGWSKPVENRHGVQERVCKCGRARIVKVTRRGLQEMFLPLLDGEALPPYWKIAEAKEALEAVARGEMPPKPSRSFRAPHEYRNIGEEAGAAGYEQTRAWFASRTGQSQQTTLTSALAVLGLQDGVTLKEVKTAVRRLMMEAHPDRNPDDDQAADRFRQVVEAAEFLEAVPVWSWPAKAV